MLLFKTNYKYNPVTSLILKQAKKRSENTKKRLKKIITPHKKLYKSAKLVQERIKLYYNKKRSEGPDLKKKNKVWLLHKNFRS